MSDPNANPKVWSILGLNLKPNTAEDFEPQLAQLRAMEEVEQVHLGGNSLGVGACEALAEIFKQKKGLKVGFARAVLPRTRDELRTPSSRSRL